MIWCEYRLTQAHLAKMKLNLGEASKTTRQNSNTLLFLVKELGFYSSYNLGKIATLQDLHPGNTQL